MNGSSTADFVYGSELQGRGFSTDTDIKYGCFTTIISLVASFGAIVNLHLIRNLKVFHNAFGFLWAMRTIGELGSDITFAIYTGPVTIMQPSNIPPTLGLFAHQLSFTFSYVQCAMNLATAINRFVAVCYPLHYKRVFNKKFCLTIAGFVMLKALFIVSLFFSELDRDYSIIWKHLTPVCFAISCVVTRVINAFTFAKIVYVRVSQKATYANKDFRRDVRLFTLCVVQDILMTITVLAIILYNHQKGLGAIAVVLNLDGLIIIYVFNTASMAFCNPECRRYLFRRNKQVVFVANGSITGLVSPNK
uniref:7TM_GPCR_Srx domain-containing protein n=1 Tax=Steinernema glaseri TaxID=37863 RepID=A0A1I8AS35_9BILA